MPRNDRSRIGKLTERERIELLRTFDEVVPRIPARNIREVEHELKSIRQARRSGGRRSRINRYKKVYDSG